MDLFCLQNVPFPSTNCTAVTKSHIQAACRQTTAIDISGLTDTDLSEQTLPKVVAESMKTGSVPELSDEGTGATYIIRDFDQNPVAVFKPSDEEAFAPCNPRGYMG
jgi:hypothetical protein